MRRTLLFLLLSGLLLTVAAQPWTWHGCALTPNGREAWVVAGESAVCRKTTDFGATWQEVPFWTNHIFFDVFFLDSTNGWTVGSLAEVWHTTDAGNVWQWQGYGVSKFFQRVQFLDPIHGWAAAGAAIMGKWSEEMQTWEQIILREPFSAETTDFYGVSFVDTLNGWICAGRYPMADTFQAGQGYLARSSNGGRNWELQVRDVVYDYFDIEFADLNTGWVVGGNDLTMQAYIGKTTDGGVHWNGGPISTAGMLRAVDFPDPLHGWAVGKFGTILHTSDGGETWVSQVSHAESTLFDVDFIDTLTGIASGYEAVVVTSDGGNTWVRCNLGIAERPAEPVPPARLIGARPSVARGAVRLECNLPAHSDASVVVYGPQGRRVKTLMARRRAPGRFDLVWDGRDDLGAPVNSGVYLVRIEAGTQSGAQRILYLRE